MIKPIERIPALIVSTNKGTKVQIKSTDEDKLIGVVTDNEYLVLYNSKGKVQCRKIN